MGVPIPNRSPGRKHLLVLSAVFLAIAVSFTGFARWLRTGPAPAGPASDPGQAPAASGREASHEEVVRACAVCHGYPPPELFPRDDWPREVQRGYEFLRKAGLGS